MSTFVPFNIVGTLGSVQFRMAKLLSHFTEDMDDSESDVLNIFVRSIQSASWRNETGESVSNGTACTYLHVGY